MKQKEEGEKDMKVSIGDMIYALRKSRGLTQEQLSVQMNVSAVAVSKWENDISMPDISVLCNLADYFEVTVDELLGRKTKQLEEVGTYQQEELYSYTIAEDLLTLCEVSRREGLLALEAWTEKLKSGEPFLRFACKFALDLCQTPFGTPEQIHFLLLHYAASERLANKETIKKRPDYEMIAEVIPEIFSGQNPEFLKELMASYLGRNLRDKLLQQEVLKTKDKKGKEILQQIKEKKPYCEDTDLFLELEKEEDFIIQLLLRQLDNEEVTNILVASNGVVGGRIFENLSQRLAYFIYEDMKRWEGTKEDLLKSGEHVLKIYHAIKREYKNPSENE